MSFMTPTHWLIVALCVIILLAIAARAFAQAWNRTEEQLEYRTANYSAIDSDTRKLHDMVPSPRRSHQIPPHRPPEQPVQIASLKERRRLMNQHEVAGAAAALIDMGKGTRRQNPNPPGTPEALGWTFGYEQAHMERDHKTADAKAFKPAKHMHLIQCTGHREFLKDSTGDRRFWPITGPGSA